MARDVPIWTGLLFALARAAQPSAPEPVAAPMRALPWGQLNFLQTTDTHGWHAGHLQEPQYSADWGDYISFAERMREKADERGVDILLVDTGDRIEGNGLYDASNPKGAYTYDIFREQEIDVISIGNHELYLGDAAAREYDKTVPNFKGRYVASNLDYIRPDTGECVPMAQRFRKFTTKNQGLRVLAFGFLFDFTGNANNTVVQPVEKTIQEAWFQDAIREDADLFLVIGHVLLHGPEYKAIFEAIRSQNWDTPIQFFGGHSHIRDFAKYDSKAYALQSGRYFETIGWMSIDGFTSKSRQSRNLLEGSNSGMKFQRRYVDNNLFGYHYHTGLNESAFPTEHGQKVSETIRKARKALNLDHSFGCAPKNLWLNRAPYPSNDSLLSWLADEVLPDVILTEDRQDVPRIAITNTGAMRFDIFKGPFTIDSTFIVSPFISKFNIIKDVPYVVAKQLLPLLNSGGPVFDSFSLKSSSLAPPEQLSIHNDILTPSVPVSDSSIYTPGNKGTQSPLLTTSKPSLIPGYTTSDELGSDGDDTLHEPISFYRVPNCIQAAISFSEDQAPEVVDVVFIDFIKPLIIMAMRFLGHVVKEVDIELYRDETLTELMAAWIGRNWGRDC